MAKAKTFKCAACDFSSKDRGAFKFVLESTASESLAMSAWWGKRLCPKCYSKELVKAVMK